MSLEQLKNDLLILNQRKEQAIQNFHQVVGAISILEQLIQREEEQKSETKDEEHVETHDQAAEQVA